MIVEAPGENTVRAVIAANSEFFEPARKQRGFSTAAEALEPYDTGTDAGPGKGQLRQQISAAKQRQFPLQ